MMIRLGLPLYALLLALAASPALAAGGFDTRVLGQRGSMIDDDVIALIGKSPKLKAAFEQAAREIGKTPGEIPCDGQRFPGPWVNLGGLRTAPYECVFGPRTMVITAKVTLTDAAGRVYDKPSAQALKKAANVQETDFAWTWKPTQN